MRLGSVCAKSPGVYIAPSALSVVCWDEPSPSQRKRGSGRPLLTVRHVRLVVRTAASGNFSAKQLNARFSLSSSARTIRRLLGNVNFLAYRKMERTLPLTAAHRQARIAFATRMLGTHQDHWVPTIFSDEKKFNLDGPDGYKFYWQDIRRPARQYKTRQMGWLCHDVGRLSGEGRQWTRFPSR